LPPLSQLSDPAHARLYSLPFGENLLSVAVSQEHAEILRTLRSLHELSTFLNLSESETDELPVEACYPDRVYTVEHSILTPLYDSVDPNRSNDIWNILRHASLLFIYTNLRQTPVGGEIRKSLSGRLRLALQSAELRSLRDFPAEMLWISCLGLVGAQDTINHRYFLSCVKSICTESSIGSWTEVIGFCRSMPTFERSCATKCKTLCINNIFF